MKTDLTERNKRFSTWKILRHIFTKRMTSIVTIQYCGGWGYKKYALAVEEAAKSAGMNVEFRYIHDKGVTYVFSSRFFFRFAIFTRTSTVEISKLRLMVNLYSRERRWATRKPIQRGRWRRYVFFVRILNQSSLVFTQSLTQITLFISKLHNRSKVRWAVAAVRR